MQLASSPAFVTECPDPTDPLEDRLQQLARLETVGALTSGIAHDFNNLLLAQIGSLELLLEGAAPGSAERELAEMAMHAAEQAAQLTRHLLAFSRRRTPRPERVEIDGVLTDLAGMLPRVLGGAITLEVSAGDGGLATLVDRTELHTVLFALALNARDAMPDGGHLDIVAHAAPADAPGGKSWVVLTVTDSGAGMPAATLARACEPFFTTKGAHASGLGLTMARGLADRSHGDLRIDSAPWVGTEVSLRLPCAGGLAADVAPRRLVGRVIMLDEGGSGGADLAGLLEGAGYSVVVVGTAGRALVRLRDDARCDALVVLGVLPGGALPLVEEALALRPGCAVLLLDATFDTAARLPGHVGALPAGAHGEEITRKLTGLVAAGRTARRQAAVDVL